jgi:hypothetical protein
MGEWITGKPILNDLLTNKAGAFVVSRFPLRNDAGLVNRAVRCCCCAGWILIWSCPKPRPKCEGAGPVPVVCLSTSRYRAVAMRLR